MNAMAWHASRKLRACVWLTPCGHACAALVPQIKALQRSISDGRAELASTTDMAVATSLMDSLAPKEIMLRELEAQVGVVCVGMGGGEEAASTPAILACSAHAARMQH